MLPIGTVLQAIETNEPGRLFAKQGLVVRADTIVELAIPSTAAANARIGWGSPAHMGRELRVPGCASTTGWLAFAGGCTVDSPTCLPLTIRSNGREAHVRIAVGVACR